MAKIAEKGEPKRQGSYGITPAGHAGDANRRVRELSRLLPLWPDEIADESPSARRRLLTILRRALRHERRRGIGGHWTYDLSRHAQLLEAYRAERAALEQAERNEGR
jgi:hypothetical protein